MADFKCTKCGQSKPVQTNGGVGYATMSDNSLVCYDCCAELDRRSMIDSGKATLYLVKNEDNNKQWQHIYKVTNWPSTLSFAVDRIRKGLHNMAGTRYDAWFTGPNNTRWYGVQYGENTQLIHCRRVKGR